MCASQRSHSGRPFFVLAVALLSTFPNNSLLAQTPSGTKTVFSEAGPQKAPEQTQGAAFARADQITSNQSESQQQQNELSINAGSTIDGVLTGGETRSYRLLLTSRQYLHAAGEQRGIDIVVVLRGPAGNQLFEMDGVVGGLGTEDLVWEATAAGSYTLEVRARSPSAPQGRYALRVELKDSAGVREHAWIDAQRLLMEGRQAQDQNSGEGLQLALKAYGAALPSWRDAGEQRWEAATLQYLGLVQLYLGDFEQSRDSFELALLITRALKDQRAEGRTLNNLSAVYRNLGDYEKARERVQQALVIWRELRSRRGEAAALNGLGNTYSLLNQIERGRDYYEQALVIMREIKDRKSEGSVLINLGIIYNELGQLDRALTYFEQALVISKDEKAPIDEATVLNNFGEVYAKLRQLDKSRDYFTQALAINRGLKDRSGEASALMNLGIGYLDVNQESLARDYLEQALSIWREIKDPRGEAAARYQLAHLARQKGDLVNAYAQASAALTIIESIRSGIAGQELRSSFLASTRDYFELCIDLLMQMHQKNPKDRHDSEALAITERARARSLLDLLTEARAEILEGADQRLIAKQHELQRQLNATATAQQQLLSGTHTSEQAAAIAKTLDSLTDKYQDLQEELRHTSPRYAALVQPQPLNLQAIQTRLLDRDTLLLVYSLGAERSYLWAVTPESLSSFELPKRELIESAVRRFRERLAAPELEDQQSPARGHNPHLPQFELAARALSKMLLLPVSGQLGNKRLLIISDGALQYLPFAALPVPSIRATAERSQPPPLIVEHEIVNLPSASTLAVIRDELNARQPAAKALAVLADPVFSAGDERLEDRRRTTSKETAAGLPITMRFEPAVDKRSESLAPLTVGRKLQPADSAPEIPQAVTSFNPEFQPFLARGSEGGLPRLPFARREAEAIASLAPPEATLKALDFKASRETATNPELGQYRIVHFATHGLLNTEHPELSGLVLSLVDEHGRVQDGFLRLHEIYNLHLPVELVVLSACQTGLGKDIKGEGLIGLTRGFMYAGAARVVASLWRVDDVATAELMRRFYVSMLRDGQRPAAALRTAQMAMWREGVWRSPYYWAGFVLQGEWR
jgi:CHAT domain-containing protein/Tfp pilus assembly protein PilF